jgi:hypothetical protein
MKIFRFFSLVSIIFCLPLSAEITLVIKAKPNEKAVLEEWIKDNKGHILVSTFKDNEFQSYVPLQQVIDPSQMVVDNEIKIPGKLKDGNPVGEIELNSGKKLSQRGNTKIKVRDGYTYTAQMCSTGKEKSNATVEHANDKAIFFVKETMQTK